MQLYAYPAFVGVVEVAKENRKLNTFSSDDITVLKGEKVFKALNGEERIVTDTSFKDMIPVTEKKQRKTFKEMSPFEQQEIENMYKQSWIEDENYISNKPL